MIDAEERDLIARAKEDPEAFGLLYRRYVKRIYNYLYRHTSNVSDAEDLTSRTFYRALKNITRYQVQQGATFQAWLFRIAHNLVVNWYRDRSRRQQVALDNAFLLNGVPLLNGAPFSKGGVTLGNNVSIENSSWVSTTIAPHEGVMIAEEQARLRQVIEQLPESRKTLILLKFVEQMSNAEIAAAMGKTEGAIKSLYHRTLISLRKAMSDGGKREV